MRILTILIIIAAILSLISCGDDLLPNYMVDKPRIIAVEISSPEINPENETPLEIKMLMGGSTIDQTMTNPVKWLVNPEDPDDFLMKKPYNESFTMPLSFSQIEEMLPEELLKQYKEAGWIDLPITAGITVDKKNYTVMKMLRLSENAKYNNPGVKKLTFHWKPTGSAVQSTTISEMGQTVTVDMDSSYGVAGITAFPEDKEKTLVDKIIYRWKVSTSKTGEGKLYVEEDKKKARQIFPGVDHALTFDQKVAFKLEKGTYDIYLTLRDKNTDSTSRKEDRLGQSFFYFTLVVK